MALFNFNEENRGRFQILPQGEQRLTITGIEYKEVLGHMIVDFTNDNGIKHREIYRFIKNDGTPNNTARGIFIRLGRLALNKPQGCAGGFDHMELVNHQVIATVVHESYVDKNGETQTKAALKHFEAEPYGVDDLDNL